MGRSSESWLVGTVVDSIGRGRWSLGESGGESVRGWVGGWVGVGGHWQAVVRQWPQEGA